MSLSILQGKTIILGVSGGIAAYKAVELLRLLQKQGAHVRVMMTRNAEWFVGPITFEIVQKYVDRVVLVAEKTLRHAVFLLWNYDKQVVEGSGAAAVAPVIEDKPLFKGKTVASVVTGGNIDSDLFQSILASER